MVLSVLWPVRPTNPIRVQRLMEEPWRWTTTDSKTVQSQHHAALEEQSCSEDKTAIEQFVKSCKSEGVGFARLNKFC